MAPQGNHSEKPEEHDSSISGEVSNGFPSSKNSDQNKHNKSLSGINYQCSQQEQHQQPYCHSAIAEYGSSNNANSMISRPQDTPFKQAKPFEIDRNDFQHIGGWIDQSLQCEAQTKHSLNFDNAHTSSSLWKDPKEDPWNPMMIHRRGTIKKQKKKN